MINNIDNFSILFNNMMEGVALHSYVYDDKGIIVDYIIEDVNPSFEKILGLKKESVIGKKSTVVFKVTEAPYLREYAGLLNNKVYQFNVFFEPLEKYFYISAISLGENGFATIFFDITEIKKIEADLKEKNKNLENINKIMVDRELRMLELQDKLEKIKNKK